MSLQAITAGILAIKGLGMLTSLIRRPETQEIAQRLESGEPVSEAEFNALIAELLEAAKAAGESDTHPTRAQELVESLIEERDELSPMLFETLDADGSGAIDGSELLHLQRLVSHLHRLIPTASSA